MADFWDFAQAAAPGMISGGLNWFGANQQKKAAQQEASALQNDPTQQGMQTAANAQLSQLGRTDPNALASDQFNKIQAIQAPAYAKSEGDLMRNLQAKGMLGLASNTTNQGDASTGAAPMNPFVSAYYAARNQQQSKDAVNAFDQSQQYVDKLVSRATNLNAGRQSAISNAAALRPAVTSAGNNAGMLKSIASGIAGNPGMVGKGIDWLRGVLGGGGGAPDLGQTVGYGGWNNAGYGTADTGANAFEGGYPSVDAAPSFQFPDNMYDNLNDFSGSTDFNWSDWYGD